MTVGLPQYKWDQLVERLQHWLSQTHFTILQAVELCGTLINVSLVCRWGPMTFFGLQAEFRRVLLARYHAITAYFRRSGKIEALRAKLPIPLEKCLTPLLARAQARALYHSKATCEINEAIHAELRW